MAYIPLEKLLKPAYKLFDLVMASAKRATELAQGAAPLVQSSAKKITSIALEEIAEGKVSFDSGFPEPSEKSSKDKGSERESKS